MTTTLRNGLIVALVHVSIVLAIGGKLLVDRASYPRAWARTAPVDPDMPIRGRYVRLLIEAIPGDGLVPAERLATEAEPEAPAGTSFQRVQLTTADGTLLALPAAAGAGLAARMADRAGAPTIQLVTPIAFFIPEDVDDPSRRPPGEELWVEVTLPPAGPPRPIRLGVGRDGVVTPLPLR